MLDSYQRSRSQSETIFKCANTCKSLNQIKERVAHKKRHQAQKFEYTSSKWRCQMKTLHTNIERVSILCDRDLRECNLRFFSLLNKSPVDLQ